MYEICFWMYWICTWCIRLASTQQAVYEKRMIVLDDPNITLIRRALSSMCWIRFWCMKYVFWCIETVCDVLKLSIWQAVYQQQIFVLDNPNHTLIRHVVFLLSGIRFWCMKSVCWCIEFVCDVLDLYRYGRLYIKNKWSYWIIQISLWHRVVFSMCWIRLWSIICIFWCKKSVWDVLDLYRYGRLYIKKQMIVLDYPNHTLIRCALSSMCWIRFWCMGWLRWVGCLKTYVSLQNIGLFCRSLLQKRPIFLSILLIVATPYEIYCLMCEICLRCFRFVSIRQAVFQKQVIALVNQNYTLIRRVSVLDVLNSFLRIKSIFGCIKSVCDELDLYQYDRRFLRRIDFIHQKEMSYRFSTSKRQAVVYT